MSCQDRPTASDGEVYRPAWLGSKTNVSYGLSYTKALLKHISDTFGSKRVYVLASGSLSRNTEHVRNLQQALGDKVVGIRHGMRPHTLFSEVVEVTNEALDLQADLLVTLGAGSLTDAAKIVSLAMANNVTSSSALEQLYKDTTTSSCAAPIVPEICIPTSLSGGEYNAGGGASHDTTHRKYGFGGPTPVPALVILDPELTTTTPERTWLSTGVRAVDHCVEGICSLQATEQSDEVACQGLKLLVPGLLRCKADAGDLKARLSCQMGVVKAVEAMNVGKVPMGASHAISHHLGPLGVGHGETSCILLPAVCAYNKSVNAAKQDLIKSVFWSETEVRKVLENARLSEHADLSDMLDAVFRALGMPRTLKEFEIGEEKFDLLAGNALHDRWIGTNPRPITGKEQVLEILEMVKG